MSVERRLPAAGILDNSHPSLIISTADGEAYESSDSRLETDPRPQPTNRLTIQTTNPSPRSDDEPQSVIHAPLGFSEFEVNRVEDGGKIGAENEKDANVQQIFRQTHPYLETQSISPPPLTTSIEPAKDWSERATPRAQTRQDLYDFDKRPDLEGESQISGPVRSSVINSGLDIPESLENLVTNEITALQAALVECWSLCNTLATLSSIHRQRASSALGDDTWRSCWRLCQQLYAGQVEVHPTLDLCRDFCQTLFEARSRDNEISDSVLRVSFELNNHLYNTHDRNLPDAFRERTLDFYITLCHRLMKQRSRAPETDSLLSACWSLAEMLFSIRQSKKEGRSLDEELLGSAVQACWELCDIFREGWTQRSQRNSDRGTPRPSQATFAAAEQDQHHDIPLVQRNPETPTTIFEDVGTTSPEEGPIQNIYVLGKRRNAASHVHWSSSRSEGASSERTSSTNTVITLSNDASLNAIKVLTAKAALNNGFQRDGAQGLSSFVKSLSSDAFGAASWQISLLKHYKALVAYEPAFQAIGPPARSSAMDIARATKRMAHSGQNLWLYDLYRLVFGFHLEEGLNRESIILQT